MITRIGDYWLNQRVEDAPDLKESSGIKRAMLMRGLLLKDEAIFDGKNMIFLNAVWEVTIGATGGTIYKISLSHFCDNKDEASIVFDRALEYLRGNMADDREQAASTENYTWDSGDVNVLLHLVHRIGIYSINLMITSNRLIELNNKLTG